MSALILKVGNAALVVLLMVVLVAWALFSVYGHGLSVKDAEWQARWNARDAGDKQAWAVDDLTERLKRATSSNSCTAAASAAATRTALVFAELFKRADARAGDLAADADQSRSRGVTCEQAYGALVQPLG